MVPVPEPSVAPEASVGKIVVIGTGAVAVKEVEASSNTTIEVANAAGAIVLEPDNVFKSVEMSTSAVVLELGEKLGSDESIVVEVEVPSGEVLKAVLAPFVVKSVETKAELSEAARVKDVEDSVFEVTLKALESAVAVSDVIEDSALTKVDMVSAGLDASKEDGGICVELWEVKPSVVEASKEEGELVISINDSVGEAVEDASEVAKELEISAEDVPSVVSDVEVVDSVDTTVWGISEVDVEKLIIERDAERDTSAEDVLVSDV
ncbi:flagellar attachment zone protein 1 [Colletotrichum tofieldiae]|nr:flagellar attachment zone protein 1 [Colletotrichum tofieldiae]